MFRQAALAASDGKNSAKAAITIGRAKSTAQCGQAPGMRL